MKRIVTTTLAVAAGLLIAAPQDAAAQTRVGNDGWWDWAVPAVESGRREARRGNGPPFCRNGRGHPVHGLEWCEAKGWSANWQRTVWDDVILRAPRDRRDRVYEQDSLGEILGSVIFGRLDAQRHQVGAHGAPLQARWVSGRGGARALQVRAGGVPIAELTDLNGDGRADVVLLNRPGS